MQDLKNQAIEAALSGDWNQAISLNEDILKENPDDIEAMSRLAFAQMERGDFKKARTNYEKLLKLDHFNPIALKNLNKLTSIKKRTFKKGSQIPNHPINLANLFLEEIGKTKVVKLKNTAELHILSQLNPGDQVELSIKRRGIVVLDKNGNYLGALPDDLAHRLIQFIKHGNKYQAFVKSSDKNFLAIFIKEVERSRRFKNQASFTTVPLTYLTSVRNEILENEGKPQVTPLEEEEETENEEEEN